MAIKDFMARGERSDSTAQAPAPAPVAPAAPATRTVAPSTSVDASSELVGKLRCKETLRIDGRVEGEVECDKVVLVGQGGRVQANIACDEVKISGLVEGNIAARRKITLERTAVVTGDLTTPGIVIEEGAKLKGRIVIGSDTDGDAQTDAAASSAKKEASAAKESKHTDADKAAAPKKPAAPKSSDTPAPQPSSTA